MSPRDTSPPAASRAPAARRFGPYVLTELLGRSARTMAWRGMDTRSRQSVVVVIPRTQPQDEATREHWEMVARRAARSRHPHLAEPLEASVHEGWPFVSYAFSSPREPWGGGGPQGLTAAEAATAIKQLGEALAYAHESGVVHGDLQPWQVLSSANGGLQLIGLAVAFEPAVQAGDTGAGSVVLAHSDQLRAHREAAQRDVLSLGILLHLCLTGQRPLDEPDIGKVVDRLPPTGRDLVRLPWSTPRPVPEALRAIANRSTDRQERQRYRSARTLVHALEGWLRVDAASDSGPLALLADRLHAVGVLPASPGGAERAARVALMDRERTSELADVVLQDVALSFELLRAVNTAQVRGAQVAGSGPVLTVRRSIAMLGLDGVRRAALALRPWPGPLNESAASMLRQQIQLAQRAARVAQVLRPAGYDAEVVGLVTLLQNLGPLVIQYHFPEDAVQIRRLMLPAPPAEPGGREEPGMSEQAASLAVLGVDVDAVGGAVARHWGLDDSVVQMMRRLPLSAAVHECETDDDTLRAVASCANEAVEAAGQAAVRVASALQRVAARYARALGVTVADLQEALAVSRSQAHAPDLAASSFA